MKPLLTELWPQFCADADFVAGYAGALVERVEADRKKRIIKVVYRTVAPVAGELRTRLCASLAPLFPGFLVCLQGLFEYDRLTPQSVLDLAMELREEGLPLNGFLYGASVEIAEQEIRVTVINGTHLLGQMKFGEMLAQQIERRTGVLPVVRLVDGAPQNALTAQARCAGTAACGSGVCTAKSAL